MTVSLAFEAFPLLAAPVATVHPPATATRAGYRQIPDENVPSSFQNAPRLESGLYQGPAPAPAAPPQQSGAYKYPPGPTAGNSSSSGAPSNAPPAYDGSTTLASGPPAAPGGQQDPVRVPVLMC